VRYPDRALPYGFLLKAYVNAEVPAYGFRERMKADNVHQSKTVKEQLMHLDEQNPDRNPLFCSYVNLLKSYAEKGDIHSAEKIFDTLKKVRYPERALPYGFLLKAYGNAEVPAYGFREGMRADNVHQSKTVKEQLMHLDNLQKAGDPKMIE
jgi:hypothetical protein